MCMSVCVCSIHIGVCQKHALIVAPSTAHTPTTHMHIYTNPDPLPRDVSYLSEQFASLLDARIRQQFAKLVDIRC